MVIKLGGMDGAYGVMDLDGGDAIMILLGVERWVGNCWLGHGWCCRLLVQLDGGGRGWHACD